MLKPALELIKEFEGFHLKAYLCPAGVPTIGWGTIRYPSGQKVRLGDRCTLEQAELWLHHEVMGKAKGVTALVQVKVNNNQFCALVSFAYNLGLGSLRGSTLLRRLNRGEPKSQIAAEFDKWIMANGRPLRGLIRRRKKERELFLMELSPGPLLRSRS